jgi:hypothetical protein
MRIDIDMNNLYFVVVFDGDDEIVFSKCIECDDIERLKMWLKNCYHDTNGYAEISHLQTQELPICEIDF